MKDDSDCSLWRAVGGWDRNAPPTNNYSVLERIGLVEKEWPCGGRNEEGNSAISESQTRSWSKQALAHGRTADFSRKNKQRRNGTRLGTKRKVAGSRKGDQLGFFPLKMRQSPLMGRANQSAARFRLPSSEPTLVPATVLRSSAKNISSIMTP